MTIPAFAIDDDVGASAYLATLTAQAERRETTSHQGSMVWHVWGEGPALVLLHGGSGSWTHWVRNIEYFSANFRVIVADLPGLGDSSDPIFPYSAESLAKIVADGIDQLVAPMEPFHLVGFSFGGIVGGHIGYLQSHRMASVTIVGSPPFGLGSTGPANEVVAVDPKLSLEQAPPLTSTQSFLVDASKTREH